MNDERTRAQLEREDELAGELLDYAVKLLGNDSVASAWAEFNFYEDAADDADAQLDDEDPFNAIFVPWFLFNRTLPLTALGRTVAEAYLKERGKSLADPDRELLTQLNGRPFSLFEVTAVAAERRRLGVRDLLGEASCEIFDEDAGEFTPGEVIFGALRPAGAGTQATMVMAPYALPAEAKAEVEELAETGPDQDEIRGFYLELLDAVVGGDETTS